ncbi:MAG: hypothetical protein PHC61_15610 [Chitinivibrionales bacterium]|nr:hypothetical protein [Chitinivibrionales bacterium]
MNTAIINNEGRSRKRLEDSSWLPENQCHCVEDRYFEELDRQIIKKLHATHDKTDELKEHDHVIA